MVPYKWVSAVDLNRWADAIVARSRLPLLIRRLIHGTVSQHDIEHINFPADEETHRPGYDGETKIKRGNAKVPEGVAYWEMGTNKDVLTKLNGDYDKGIRTRGSGDFSQRLIKLRHPTIAWYLLLALIPEPGSSIMQHEPPQWRYWAERWRRGVTNGDYARMISGAVQLLLEILPESPGRLIDLLPYLNRLNARDQTRTIDLFSDVCPRLDADVKGQVWVNLCEFTRRQRYFAGAQWALVGEPLQKLESIQESLRPQDPVQLALPLFKKGPDMVGDRSMSWQEQEALRGRQRLEAIQKILYEKDFQGIVDLAHHAELSWPLGQAVFEASGEKYETAIIPALLGHSNPLVDDFAKAYFQFRLNAEHGRAWAESQQLTSWTTAQAAALVSQMPFDERTWKFAAAVSGDIETRYWQVTAVYGTNLSTGGIEATIRKLIEIGRVRSAVHLVATSLDKTNLAPVVELELLEMALTATFALENEKPINPHDVHAVLERAQKNATVDRGKLARVEWLLLPMLNGPAFPTTLHLLLSESAEFFIEVLSTAYKSSRQDSTPNPADDKTVATQQHAERAWRLFREWKRPPGMLDNGTIDGAALRAWVELMRSKAAECERIAVADLTLGEVFAYAPNEVDGTWPCIAVREIIEVIDCPEIARGFSIGISNKRGSYVKSPREGGRQERELAASYKRHAEQCRIQWPKTAKALLDVAHDYEHMAKYEDGEAERRW